MRRLMTSITEWDTANVFKMVKLPKSARLLCCVEMGRWANNDWFVTKLIKCWWITTLAVVNIKPTRGWHGVADFCCNITLLHGSLRSIYISKGKPATLPSTGIVTSVYIP